MKRINKWLLVLLCVCLIGCEGSILGNSGKEEQPIPLGGKEYEKLRDSVYDNWGTLIALKDFAAKTTPLLMVEGKNANYSPTSLYLALAVLQSGAEGSTKQEILNLLEVEEKELKEFVPVAMDTTRVEGGAEVLLANSIWLGEGPWEPEERFRSDLEKIYRSSAFQVPFGNTVADEKINRWIKDKTKGHLDMSIETSDDTKMLLMNALYFKSLWEDGGLPDSVEDQAFTLIDGEEIEVPTMCFHRATALEQGENYTMVTRHMEGARMVFLLPDEDHSPWDMMWDSALMTKAIYGPNIYEDVILYLPIFDFQTEFSLKESLQKLGMKEAFSGSAQFSPLGAGPLLVSDIMQNTRITVKEEGVEASAVTTVEMEETATPLDEEPSEPIIVRLNRPFIYILEYMEMPLFVGICANPSQ